MKKYIRKFRIEFLKTMVKMVTSAFALVAALAWNTSISEIIKRYIQSGNSVSSWLIYAMIVTILAVIVGIYLSGLNNKIKEEEKELNK